MTFEDDEMMFDELSGDPDDKSINVLSSFEVTEMPQYQKEIVETVETYEQAARYVTGHMKKIDKENGTVTHYAAENEPDGILSPQELAAAMCMMMQERMENIEYYENNTPKNLPNIEERIADIERRLEGLM